MRHGVITALCASLLMSGVYVGSAQNTASTADRRVAAARAAVAPASGTAPSWQSFDDSFTRMCADPSKPAPQVAPTAGGNAGTRDPSAPKAYWYTEPAKVFDNLYYLGLRTGQATWALMDSAGGIVLIDAGWDYTAQGAVVDGLKHFGLDPAEVRYIVITHAHPDHYTGARYLQDNLRTKTGERPRIVMSEADWKVLAGDSYPPSVKPTRDMVATDGQKLTIGSTTVTLYVTPGHTPGTLSVIFPVKEGNQGHLASMWGGVILGTAPGGADGVTYFPDAMAQIKAYVASAKRFREIAEKAGVDVLISSIERHDSTAAKLAALKTRRQGESHPFVSKDLVKRYWDVIINCEEAQLVWAEMKSSR